MSLRIAGDAGPQASGRVPVPGEMSMTHEADRRDQPVITRLVFS
jgi:hypothetical protein